MNNLWVLIIVLFFLTCEICLQWTDFNDALERKPRIQRCNVYETHFSHVPRGFKCDQSTHLCD